MHEVSLVQNIFTLLEEQFTKEDLNYLREIKIKVGLLSNVEPTLLQNAFIAVTNARRKYQSVMLRLEFVSIVVHCQSCNKDSIIEHFKFVCAYCGLPNKNLISGTELLIDQLIFDDERKAALPDAR